MSYRRAYSRSLEDFGGRRPKCVEKSTVATLGPGQFTHIGGVATGFWSSMSGHFIVKDTDGMNVAIPANIIGRLLDWLKDAANPPRVRWYEIPFWLFRTSKDDWVWFGDGSDEAMSYLPWKHVKGNKILEDVMKC